MDKIRIEHIKTDNMLDLSKSIAGDFISQYEFPWQVLCNIGDIIKQLIQGLSLDEYDQYSNDVWISKSADVAKSAIIGGPTIIDHGAEVRHCAYIRGNAIVGRDCVVGNSTELKNVILFNDVQVPHYNYVGDSILGYKSHMGAGAITSNMKSDKSLIKLNLGDHKEETGLRKFGAIIGDHVEIGCNSVLNPGTIVGKNTNIYPLVAVRGYVPSNSILKCTGEIVTKK